MPLPEALSATCPLCGEEFAVRVQPTQAVVMTDRDTGGRVVSLNVIVDTPTHTCSAVPDAAAATARKPTTKKSTAKRTTRTT